LSIFNFLLFVCLFPHFPCFHSLFGREHWHASLAAASGDETQSTHTVFARLASVSVAARIFGPNGPFSFPHAPVALERLLVYRADGNTVVFTAETDVGFMCFRFYTS
jgi:hypothetical protein